MIALSAGCATTVEQRGNLPAQDKIAGIQPGSTTKDEVVKILGSPSSVSVFDDKSWYYISRRTGQFAFLDPNVIDQQVYIVNFDDQGVVKAVGPQRARGREGDCSGCQNDPGARPRVVIF